MTYQNTQRTLQIKKEKYNPEGVGGGALGTGA